MSVKHVGGSRGTTSRDVRVKNAIEQRTRVSKGPLRWTVVRDRAATTSTMDDLVFDIASGVSMDSASASSVTGHGWIVAVKMSCIE